MDPQIGFQTVQQTGNRHMTPLASEWTYVAQTYNNNHLYHRDSSVYLEVG